MKLRHYFLAIAFALLHVSQSQAGAMSGSWQCDIHRGLPHGTYLSSTMVVNAEQNHYRREGEMLAFWHTATQPTAHLHFTEEGALAIRGPSIELQPSSIDINLRRALISAADGESIVAALKQKLSSTSRWGFKQFSEQRYIVERYSDRAIEVCDKMQNEN